MPVVVVSEDSTMCEHSNKYRKPRYPNHQETDPNSIRYKPTISSILFTNEPTTHDATTITTTKKKNFTSATFRGLGCTASSQVSVPAIIRTSADWEARKVKKKKMKSKKIASNTNTSTTTIPPLSQSSLSLALSSSCVSVPDVWCGPGIGLTTDATSIDCVVSRRPPNLSARGKVDGVDKIILGQRERSPYTVRRMVTPEDAPFLEPDNTSELSRFRAEVSGSRYHRNVRHGFREGIAEIVVLQNTSVMGGRSDRIDRYMDLRLDVDTMSYEELLELGERIGHVSTGLREDEIEECLRRSKLATERKCSICQEEYEVNDETGKLNCGHCYHIDCIKQWLVQKNICPICKTAAAAVSQV